VVTGIVRDNQKSCCPTEHSSGKVRLHPVTKEENDAGKDWNGEPIDTTKAVKFDDGKLPYELIAPEFLEALTEILDFGQKKYAPRNWEKGMDWSRPFGALMRHAWEWWKGNDLDQETGKSHLWHMSCCAMFLVVYEIKGLGNDDRPQ